MKLRHYLYTLLALFLYYLPTLTWAAGTSNCPTGGSTTQLCDPLGPNSSLQGFFGAVLSVLMVFAVPFILFFIIYAGFMYVTARGDTSKIKTAHNALLYAVLGGVIILGAQVLFQVLQGTISQFSQ